MAKRVLGKLSARAVATLGVGRHSDGGGLYLVVTKAGGRSWVLRFTLERKMREMGLGGARDVTLAEARRKAESARAMVRDGKDPLADGAKDKEDRSFGAVADGFIAAQEAGWRNSKHRAQWAMTLRDYAAPLRPKPVDAIGTEDVLAVLQPLWTVKPETASRLRGRIERVLDHARVRGWRSGENPARWRGHLDHLLPKRDRLTRGHHKAMAYDEVPAFVASLRERQSMAARALEFTILTAARTGEVLGAAWDEIDFEKAVWTVPATRMKAKREHRVPLSGRALAILRELEQARDGAFVFSGQRRSQPLSNMAMLMLLDRMGKREEATAHGFRSAFRDWAAECTNTPNEVCEAALAHTVSNAVEAAYRRGDLFEKRRALMAAWATFCEGQSGGNVIPLARQAGG